MATVRITADFRGITHELETFAAETSKASSRALNRTIRDRQTAAVDLLASAVGLDTATVKKATDLDLAAPGRLTATLRVNDKRIPLIKFGAVQTPAGVASRRGFVPHGFIARMRSGHIGVFRRVSLDAPLRRGPRRSWLPIRERFGPSLAHEFQRPEVYEPLVAPIQETLAANLRDEVKAPRA